MTFQRSVSRFTVVLLLTILGAIAFGFTTEAAALTEPTTLSLELKTELRITNTGADPIKYLRVIVPLVLQTSSYGHVASESFNHLPTDITIDDHGQRIGTFYVENLAPGEQFVLIQKYEVIPARIANYYHSGQVVQSKVEADDYLIRSTAAGVVRLIEQDRDKVLALLKFVRDHVRYNGESTSRNHGALAALQTGEGVCEDFAALFVSMAKAVGLDARVVYGYRSVGNSYERHAWAECWLDDKWIPVDPVFSSELDGFGNAIYLAQWFEERPIRVRHSGGSIQGALTETVTRSMSMLAASGDSS